MPEAATESVATPAGSAATVEARGSRRVHPGAGVPRPSRRPGRVPRLVWALTGLQLTLMIVFTLLYPAYTGFDEAQHVDMVVALRSGDGWPAPGERIISSGVAVSAGRVLGGELSERPYTNTAIPPRGERDSLAELGGARPSDYPVPNQLVQHPPLYYAVGAAALAVIPGSQSWPYDRTVAVLRLLSVLMVAPLPLLAWATARALGAQPLAATAAAAVPIGVPGLARVGAMVNNDNLFILTASSLLLVLARVATGDLRRRTALAAGVLTGLALLAKGFALVLPLVVVAAYLVGGRAGTAGRGGALGRWLPALLALGVGFVVGGWWWVRNLVQYDALQPLGLGERWTAIVRGRPRPAGSEAPLADFIAGMYNRLSSRSWGGLAINYEPPELLTQAQVNGLALLAAVGVVAALGFGVGRRTPHRLAIAVVAVVPFALTLLVIARGAYITYDYNLTFAGVQGRYLYGSITTLAAAVAIGYARLVGRLRTALPLLVLAGGLLLQLYGVRYALARLWLPAPGEPLLERLWSGLAGVLRWSPWPVGVTATCVVLTVLVGLVALGLAARNALVGVRRPAP